MKWSGYRSIIDAFTHYAAFYILPLPLRMIGSLPQWFDAAQHNNVEYIERYIHKYANKVDKRAHNPDSYIFKGFAAVHYAIFYGKMDAFKTLFKNEFLCKTKY